MKTLEISISIPQSKNQRSKPNEVVQWLAELLEERLNEIAGDACLGDRDTVAATLGIDDCVFTIQSGKYLEEVTT